MTDNYEFSKSSISQDENKYSPYSRKDWNYLNDINTGVYTNSSQSLVTFDLSSIYNSSKFTDTNDMYIVLPITLVAAFSNAGTLVAPVSGNYSLLSLVTNNVNLIHQCDVVVNGKVIEQVQPYINKYLDVKMLSEMSINDLKTVGPSIGFSDNIDNTNSVQLCPITAVTASYSGNGVCNNRPYSSTVGYQYQSQITAAGNPQNAPALTVNNALSQRIGSRYVDASSSAAASATTQNIYGSAATCLMTSTQLATEFKPYYTVLNTNYMVWYDACVIKLSHLFDSMSNIGLVKRFDGVIRLYVNTGSINVNVTSPNTTTLGYYSQLSQSSFTNSCPIVCNYLPATSANGGIPATTTNIIAGCYISKPASTSYSGINLSLSGASHPMSACRCYYSQIEVKPQIALKYVEENRAKKVVYRSVITNQYNNISSGSSFNQLIQSGIKFPHSIIILPFLDSTSTSFGSGNFGPGGSPFDCNVSHPLSLTNVQISLGGVNVLSNTIFYTYEEFLTQVNTYESLTSSDFGVNSGLISKEFWEINRMYVVNLSRSTNADMTTPRNVNISFNNNNQCAISILVFLVYLDDLTIDVETGIVQK